MDATKSCRCRVGLVVMTHFWWILVHPSNLTCWTPKWRFGSYYFPFHFGLFFRFHVNFLVDSGTLQKTITYPPKGKFGKSLSSKRSRLGMGICDRSQEGKFWWSFWEMLMFPHIGYKWKVKVERFKLFCFIHFVNFLGTKSDSQVPSPRCLETSRKRSPQLQPQKVRKPRLCHRKCLWTFGWW